MSLDLRYAYDDDYPQLSAFLDTYWGKDHVYVRQKALFDWTFGRRELWGNDGYSFALAEDHGEVVGILGGIPFMANCFGRSSRGVWLANYMVRPDYRRGALALRLLNMFRQPPFTVTIAFGVSTAAAPLYSALRAHMLTTIPRHMAIFPDAVERFTRLLLLTYPDWPLSRARTLAEALRYPHAPEAASPYGTTIPAGWDTHDWPRWAACTVGATRDSAYLRWRYQSHPTFTYHILTVPEGKRTGLAVWRLETIQRSTSQGRKPVDCLGRLLEFLPTSRTNAEALLTCFWQALREADALGADYYGYHGGLGAWLHSQGFHAVHSCVDGLAVPARFQPLDGQGSSIVSAVFASDDMLRCDATAQCPWYWTKSDADQDRPN
ncbi:MAG: GNAT family N-acetyltransferase [Candidatus Tectimicrobiota bacterium]